MVFVTQEHIQNFAAVHSRCGHDVREGFGQDRYKSPTHNDDNQWSPPLSGEDVLSQEEAAMTAKEFFENIFHTETDFGTKRALDLWLITRDITDREFEAICLDQVRLRLADARAQLNPRSTIPDEKLTEACALENMHWPFVLAI